LNFKNFLFQHTFIDKVVSIGQKIIRLCFLNELHIIYIYLTWHDTIRVMSLAFHSWYRSILIKSFNEHLNQVVFVYSCVYMYSDRTSPRDIKYASRNYPSEYLFPQCGLGRLKCKCMPMVKVYLFCNSSIFSTLYKTPINIINSTDKDFD
jgi:hypothetical protein